MTQLKKRKARHGAHPTCRVCGCSDKFDFNVPDTVWTKIIPAEFQNDVVCLECFDELAFERDVDYSGSIETLYFAGNQATFKFQTVTAQGI